MQSAPSWGRSWNVRRSVVIWSPPICSRPTSGLDAHRSIYQRILDLDQSSRPIDEISLAEELLAHGELEKIGGRAYLLDLSYLVVPDRKRVLYHAAITTKNARLRSIQVMGEGAQAAAGTPGADPKQLGRELIA